MNQSSLWYLAILFFLLISFFCIEAHQERNCHDIVVMAHNSVDKEILKRIFPEPFLVEKLSFESDVFFSEQEFLHLFNSNNGDQINYDHIVVALERCIKKNKFATIKMTSTVSDDGVMLHFVFESVWSFKKIKIHNVYQKKHALLQFYLMETGDSFEESKHDHSISKIKEFLINNGYFDCNIKSIFEYDHFTKEVIVHIFIKKCKQFYCGAIVVEIIIEV